MTATQVPISTDEVSANPGAPPPKEALPKFVQGETTWLARALLYFMVYVPFIALLAAIPLLIIGGWFNLAVDLPLAVGLYAITMHGVGGGFHRGFTHMAFRMVRGLRIGLAVAGSLAIEGPIINWVADHRRHHEFSDDEGDPHSPWRYGTDLWNLLKGLIFAHIGWMFSKERQTAATNKQVYAKDLLDDPDMVKVSKAFPVFVVISLAFPPLVGGLVTWSVHGAISAFIWGSLVRISLMHHVTWSTNSLAHVYGNRPFNSKGKDRSTNFWPLAWLSFGESWHNLHHADPTMARHGVLPHQHDANARLIRLYELFGWATKVRWPDLERLNKKLKVPLAA